MKQLYTKWTGLLLLVLLLTLGRAALAAGTQVTWYGHSAFKITTPSGKVLLLDPWITNPANPNGKSDLAGITRADYILITHGHSDHVGDSVDLATRTGAKLVATYDLSNALVAYGGYPKAQAGEETAGNFGGTLTLADGEVQVTFVPAVHSSAVVAPDDTAGANPHYAGNPGGFLIRILHGPTIYDTGDTDLFSDMALIPTLHKVDLMLCCIGDHFTMGPSRAADAVQLIRPSAVIPTHYGTFPQLTGTPEAFRAALARDAYKGKLYVMKVDQTLTF